jgi:serine/threonine-protein kinase
VQVVKRAATSEGRNTNPSKSARTPPEQQLLGAGSMVGDYQITEKVGEGGMGVVYAAVHPVISKRAAVKVMNASLSSDVVSVDRFVREARAVNEVAHPNIVDIFALGKLVDGRPYLVMEWLAGVTLAARLDQGPMPPSQCAAVLLQICDALSAAHERDIIHRDLKPDNVFLIDQRGRTVVKLLDFGVAKLLGGKEQSATQSGGWIGTPLYMSPEQARSQPISPATDVYALGVVAYEMFLGRLPFVAPSSIDILHMHLHAAPPSPRALWPSIPNALEQMILAMLAKDPSARPPLRAVIDVFTRVADGTLRETPTAEPVAETPEPVAAPATVAAPPPRRRAPVFLISLALLAAGGAATYHFWPAPPKPTPTPPVVVAAPVEAPQPPPVAPVAAPEPGRVDISVNVPARIQIDSVVVANAIAHADFPLAPGPHSVVITATGYKPHRETVSTTAGARIALEVTLERGSGSSHPAKPQRKDLMNPFGN